MRKLEEFTRLLHIRRLLEKSQRDTSWESITAIARASLKSRLAIEHRSSAAAALFIKASELIKKESTNAGVSRSRGSACSKAINGIAEFSSRKEFLATALKSAKSVYKLIALLSYYGASALVISSGFASGDSAAANYFLAGCNSATPVPGVEAIAGFKQSEHSAVEALEISSPDVVFLTSSLLSGRILQILSGGDFFIVGALANRGGLLFVDQAVPAEVESEELGAFFSEFALDAYVLGAKLRASRMVITKSSLISELVFL